MSYRPVDLPPPFGGTDQGSSDERPRPNTTRTGRNVRPRDWRYFGRTRMAQRPGVSRLLDDDPLNADEPVNAVVSTYLVENVGDTTLGAVVYTDDFTGRGGGTAADNLGSFVLTGTADYNVCGSDPASSTNVGGISYEMSWNSATGWALVNASGKCVDNRNDNTGTGDASVSFCYLRPDGSAPSITDNFSMRLTFTVEATVGVSETVLGFVLFGVAGTVSGGAVDSSYFCGIRFASGNTPYAVHSFNNTSSVGGFQWNRMDPFASSGGYLQKPAFNTGDAYNESAADGRLTNTYLMNDGTQHVLEARKIGTRVVLLIDDAIIVDIPNIAQRRDGTGTTAAITSQTDYGFVFNNVGSGARAAAQSIDKFEVYNASANAPPMAANLVAVSEGSVYVGSESSMEVASSGGTDAVGVVADMCAIVGPGPGSTSGAGFQYVYLLDGASYKKSKLPSGVVTTWSASSGSLPSASADSSVKARYGVLWRNRIVMYGVAGNNDLMYASKISDADNWNYSPTFPDGTEAWNLNAPGPIFCLHPMDEDRLLVGLADRLYVLVGDYADGGSLEEVSASIGVVGHFAACKDDKGNTYFVSHQGGLYVIPKGGTDPQPLSRGRRDDFFAEADPAATIRLVWTNAEEGLHVFVTPAEEPDEPTSHLFWDRASDSFWDDTLPPEYGPTAHCILNNSEGREVLVIGGWDGYLRYLDIDADDDDGEDVDAAFDYPPIVNGSFQRSILGTVEARLGADADECTLGVVSARSARDLPAESPRVSKAAEGASRAVRLVCAVGGSALSVRVGNNGEGRFSIESARAWLEDGGDYNPNETTRG